MALEYIEPRFCDYSHEIQCEIGENDVLTCRLVKNEACNCKE